MFLHSWHPQPILLHLGSLTIHWYGLTLALGALAAFFLMRSIAKRYQISENVIFDVFLLLIISGVLGARLYHVVNEWSYYQANPAQIIQIWRGGLAWHGGLIAGLLALIVFCRRRKLSFWQLADIIVPGLALGQAIGRWGNYFNQELFGKPTTLAWGIPIDPINRPVGYVQVNFYHPTFLYESLGLLLITGILIWLHRRRSPTSPPGLIALTYLILAAGLRIATESLRIDRTPLIHGIRLPILAAGVIMAAAAIWLYFRIRSTHVHRT